MSSKMIPLMVAALVCALSVQSTVAIASSPEVLVQSKRTTTEMSEYVEDVDRRLQKGRYDGVEKKDHIWIIAQIAEMREAISIVDAAQPPSPELVQMASEFETGMIRIEEGGIVCRKERRTGSRMVEQRCYSRKRLQEDAENSRESLQRMNRKMGLPAEGPG